MVESIGTVPVSTIQEIIFSESVETEELDLLSDDSNIIVTGDNEVQEIDFLLVLDRNSHPEGISIEEQREDIKRIVRRRAEENSIKFESKQGHLSIENINIPEKGDIQNINEVDVEGKFLPWPKHFPDNEPLDFFFIGGNFSGTSDIDAELSTISYIEGTIDSRFDFGRHSEFGSSIYGDGLYGTGKPHLSFYLSLVSETYHSLNFGEEKYGQKYGELYSGSRPRLNLSISIEGEFSGTLNSSAEIGKKGYGYDYGYDYGGFIDGFGSGSYGDGIYGTVTSGFGHEQYGSGIYGDN